MKNDLGKSIRARRKELKITAEELAKKIGVDRTFISKIEAHGMLPSREVLKRMETVLKTNSLLELYIEKKAPFLENRFFHSLYSMPVSFRNTLKSQESEDLARFINRTVEFDLSTAAIRKELETFLMTVSPEKKTDQQLLEQILNTCAELKNAKKTYWEKFQSHFKEIDNIVRH